MRPAGEIRAALRSAAEQLAPSVGAHGFTYRDLAPVARVGYEAARRTVWNMAKAGELQPVAPRAVPGIRRPLQAFLPSGAKTKVSDPSKPLAVAMRGFVGAY